MATRREKELEAQIAELTAQIAALTAATAAPSPNKGKGSKRRQKDNLPILSIPRSSMTDGSVNGRCEAHGKLIAVKVVGRCGTNGARHPSCAAAGALCNRPIRRYNEGLTRDEACWICARRYARGTAARGSNAR